MSKRQHPTNPEYADAAVNALVFILIVFFKFVILLIEQQRQQQFLELWQSVKRIVI